MQLKILMQEKINANQRCQQWTQTFRNWPFLDVKRTNNYSKLKRPRHCQ